MIPEILLSNGKMYHYLSPDPDVVDIQMIAASLSKQCRFTGQVNRFYSVAEHSVRASQIVPTEFALDALLHDAAEALVVDLPTPLKILLPDYKVIEDRAHELISKKFGVRFPLPPEVKRADVIMLATEKRDLLPESEAKWAMLEGVPTLSGNLANQSGNPGAWERKFLNRYHELVTA